MRQRGARRGQGDLLAPVVQPARQLGLGGRIVAQGDPAQVITAELVEDVYGMKCQIIDDPETGTPLVIPRASPRDRARRR